MALENYDPSKTTVLLNGVPIEPIEPNLSREEILRKASDVVIFIGKRQIEGYADASRLTITKQRSTK